MFYTIQHLLNAKFKMLYLLSAVFEFVDIRSFLKEGVEMFKCESVRQMIHSLCRAIIRF